MKTFLIIILLLLFLLGVYFYAITKFVLNNVPIIPYINPDPSSCPNVLIQNGNVLLMYNSQNTSIPPTIFNSLDDYIIYTKKQKEKGINCPILYLQKENDTQGNDVYRVRPSPFALQGGMQPINAGSSPAPSAIVLSPSFSNEDTTGFDPLGINNGIYTKLDELHDSTAKVALSDNPMDANWGGVGYTQNMVDSGKYIGNTIDLQNYTFSKF